MAFIGDILGGYGARQVGKFNQTLYNEEARLKAQNAELKKQTFLTVDKPRIVAQHYRDQSNMLVNFIKSGVDVSRIGDSPFLVMLDQTAEQAFDLEIAEFNSTVEFQNELNNASLLRARGESEAFKGDVAFRTGLFKGGADIYKNQESYRSLLG
tara:strand:+ start:45 stop:506 length:462 start_codon:yes stop_codon:yes gene_type:complete